MKSPTYRTIFAATLALLALPHFALAVVINMPAFFAVGGAILLLAALAFAVDRFWAVVPGVVVSAVFFVHSFVFVSNLARFDSAGEFGYVLSCVVLCPLAVTFGVIDLNARRKNREAVATTSVVRGAALAVVALVAVITASGMVTISARSTVSASERDGALVVRYKNTDIVEGDDALTAQAGAPVRIVVDNKDVGRHDFVIEGTDVDVDLTPKESKLVEVDLAPGTYTFKCTISGHSAMTGTLVVK